MGFGIALSIVVLCAILGALDHQRTGLYLGTAALTLLLAGLIHMSLRMCEKRNNRIAGFISLGVVSTAWAFVILSIWTDELGVGGPDTMQQLAASASAVVACWLPLGTGGIALRKANWTRCGSVMLGGFGLVLVIWLLGLWSGRPAEDIAGTIVPLATATILVALLQPNSRLPALLRQSASLIAVVAAFAWAWLWLEGGPVQDALLQVDFMIAAFSVAAMTGGVNLLIDLRLPRADWLRMVTFAMLLVTLVLACLLIHQQIVLAGPGGTGLILPMLARLLFASILVTVACAIAITALVRARQALVESSHDFALSLTCPRCHRNVKLEQGDQICPWCALRFRLAFESPDCGACGYVLAPQFPDQCPECGTLVVADVDAPGPIEAATS